MAGFPEGTPPSSVFRMSKKTVERLPWFYYTGRWLVRRLLSLTRFELEGIENVPAVGPLIIASNHLGLADPPILGAVIPREIVFMAKEELFRYGPLVSYFVRSYGAFPVKRGRPAVRAVREALDVLSKDKAIVIFPEGQRSRTGKLKEPFPGAAAIALASGAPVLPVGISGTEVMDKFYWVFRRPRVRVNIGRPFYPGRTGQPGKLELRAVTDDIMERIARLLPEQYRGKYGRDTV